jgi:hypothetical protein
VHVLSATTGDVVYELSHHRVRMAIGLAFDRLDNLYVCDAVQGDVHVFSLRDERHDRHDCHKMDNRDQAHRTAREVTDAHSYLRAFRSHDSKALQAAKFKCSFVTSFATPAPQRVTIDADGKKIFVATSGQSGGSDQPLTSATPSTTPRSHSTIHQGVVAQTTPHDITQIRVRVFAWGGAPPHGSCA